MPSIKQVVSTGKVIWLEHDGKKSSPVRFASEGSTLYILANGKYERIPPLSDGDIVTVTGHELSKPTQAGRAAARVRLVPPDAVDQGILLDLAGTEYDASRSPDDNFKRLKDSLRVIALDLS